MQNRYQWRFVDEADRIFIAMPMYNLIEYNNNYSNRSGNLWQFEKRELPVNNDDLTIAGSKSFKYKAVLMDKQRVLSMKIA